MCLQFERDLMWHLAEVKKLNREREEDQKNDKERKEKEITCSSCINTKKEQVQQPPILKQKDEFNSIVALWLKLSL